MLCCNFFIVIYILISWNILIRKLNYLGTKGQLWQCSFRELTQIFIISSIFKGCIHSKTLHTRAITDCDDYTSYLNFVTGNSTNQKTTTFKCLDNSSNRYIRILKKGHNSGTSWLRLSNYMKSISTLHRDHV